MEERPVNPAELRQVRKRLEPDPAGWLERGAFSYPAALSLTLHLESRRGFSGLVDLLENLAEGRDTDRALRETFGEGWEEVCRRWAEQLDEDGTRR
jgi:hypothetical protein